MIATTTNRSGVLWILGATIPQPRFLRLTSPSPRTLARSRAVDDVRLMLELLDERRVRNGVVYLRYRTKT